MLGSLTLLVLSERDTRDAVYLASLSEGQLRGERDGKQHGGERQKTRGNVYREPGISSNTASVSHFGSSGGAS